MIKIKDESGHVHKIYNTTPYSDYIRLKDQYKTQEIINKKPMWFRQLVFNTNFLKAMRDQAKGNLVCVFCGKPHLKIFHWNDKKKDENIMATCDHFWAKAKGGGAFDINNLVPACHTCNQTKTNKVFKLNSLKYLNHYPEHEKILNNLKKIGKELGYI